MRSLRQHNSRTKFWLAKKCMFRFDVEELKLRKAIMFCQPKKVLLVNMNMLYTQSYGKKRRKIFYSWWSQSWSSFEFFKKISFSVTHKKLDFDFVICDRKLNFKGLCFRLKNLCPHFHTSMLPHACLTINSPSVIQLCTEFLQNFKQLVHSKCVSGNYCNKKHRNGNSKVDVLYIDLWNPNVRTLEAFLSIHFWKCLT